MRDVGLDEAIRVAGGVGALARKIGISQPSVSNWSRVPAERVLSVEAATGVSRALLRPDLYAEHPGTAGDIDEVDAARAQEYALLSVLLARAPDAGLLERLGALRGDASPLGLVHGSYYLTGFLHERPLARLRADLDKLGIERVAGQAEPEDHAAILCEIMAGLASRRFDAPAGSDRELFEQHLAPWIGRFFADLEQAEAADFYRGVGRLGRVFIDIETDAFALPS